MVLPEQLHPGTIVALRRADMDETQLAQAMREGELASPQKFANSWYFNLRITGTGAAYRNQLKEYVWRDPSLYLNEGFRARCNGLPVIVEHPPGLMLNSEEFSHRVIGTIVLPYIEGDEVWGIARILNEAAARYMRDHDTSTSPTVVFKDPDVNDTVKMEDGKHLLIEGKPSLLDHLAICELGTWDKGGSPAGVDTSNGDEGMAEETTEEKKEEDRQDAAATEEKLDKILVHIDSMHKKHDALAKRMDAYDASRKDDTEEKAEEEEKQAAELKKLAAEEEKEAEEAREDDDKKRDDDDDKKRDDDNEEEGEEEKRDDAAGHHLHRRDDESMAAHSRRVDSFARKHRLDSLMCRDDESARDHSCRVDEMSPEDFESMGTPKAAESSNDDRKRDDSRKRDDDRKRDDEKRADAALKKLGLDLKSVKDAVRALDRKLEDPSETDRAAFADAQARADAVFAQFGEQAPPALRGEGLLAYQVRLTRALQKHSKVWAKVDLASIAKVDKGAFGNAQQMIYADAVQAARSPTDLPPLTLRAVTKKRPGGGEETTFLGDPLATWLPFMAPARAATRISHKQR